MGDERDRGKPGGGGPRALLAMIRKEWQVQGHSLRSPEFLVAAVYRFGVWSAASPPGPARWLTGKLYGLLLMRVQATTQCTIHREARIGEAFHLVHAANIHIHPDAEIGDRCGIMHDVTIGSNMEREGVPKIGDDVFIGAGAKVLGNIRIGDFARIAANSLVISDVPEHATAVGVPARIMRVTGRSTPEKS
jgi:serine O-acetyltransferase